MKHVVISLAVQGKIGGMNWTLPRLIPPLKKINLWNYELPYRARVARKILVSAALISFHGRPFKLLIIAVIINHHNASLNRRRHL